jgi:short-subunit dehydrogenase
MRVKGKTFVVTGAGNGIGRELTLQLLSLGARVAGLDLSEKGLQETSSLANSESFASYQVDISNLTEVTSSQRAILTKFGSVDGVINVAGIIHPFVRVNDLSFEQIKKVMDVNFYGLLNVTKSYLPHLLGRPEAHIANVSSMGGFVPVPGQSIYGASKAAVKLLTEGLYSELKDTRVGVTAIFPGGIATDIVINSGVMTEDQMKQMAAKAGPTRKTTSVADAAKAIISGVEKKRFHVLIGPDAKTMYLLSRIMPERAANLIYKNMKELLG